MAERVECLYRVSTTKQVDHDDQNQADIPVQRKACREFAEMVLISAVRILEIYLETFSGIYSEVGAAGEPAMVP